MAKGTKTGGRTKGTPNKATASVKEAARKHGTEALSLLVKLMKDSTQAGPVRVSAAKEILDRAYGKATQPIAGDDDMPPVAMSLSDFYAGNTDKA